MATDPGPQTEVVARAILEEAGYRPIEPVGFQPPAVRTGFGASWALVGERGFRRRGTSSMTRIPIAVVLGAGIALGALDAYIVGSVVVGVYWTLGGAVIAGLFWLRYGGTYESDLFVVTVARPTKDAAPGPAAVSVIFTAGRMQSHVRGSVREPRVVWTPLRLAREVGALSKKFREKIGVP